MPGGLAGWPDELPGQLSLDWMDALLAAQPFLPPMTDAERAALVERLAGQTTPEVQRSEAVGEMVSHHVDGDPFEGL